MKHHSLNQYSLLKSHNSDKTLYHSYHKIHSNKHTKKIMTKCSCMCTY